MPATAYAKPVEKVGATSASAVITASAEGNDQFEQISGPVAFGAVGLYSPLYEINARIAKADPRLVPSNNEIHRAQEIVRGMGTMLEGPQIEALRSLIESPYLIVCIDRFDRDGMHAPIEEEYSKLRNTAIEALIASPNPLAEEKLVDVILNSKCSRSAEYAFERLSRIPARQALVLDTAWEVIEKHLSTTNGRNLPGVYVGSVVKYALTRVDEAPVRTKLARLLSKLTDFLDHESKRSILSDNPIEYSEAEIVNVLAGRMDDDECREALLHWTKRTLDREPSNSNLMHALTSLVHVDGVETQILPALIAALLQPPSPSSDKGWTGNQIDFVGSVIPELRISELSPDLIRVFEMALDNLEEGAPGRAAPACAVLVSRLSNLLPAALEHEANERLLHISRALADGRWRGNPLCFPKDESKDWDPDGRRTVEAINTSARVALRNARYTLARELCAGAFADRQPECKQEHKTSEHHRILNGDPPSFRDLNSEHLALLREVLVEVGKVESAKGENERNGRIAGILESALARHSSYHRDCLSIRNDCAALEEFLAESKRAPGSFAQSVVPLEKETRRLLRKERWADLWGQGGLDETRAVVAERSCETLHRAIAVVRYLKAVREFSGEELRFSAPEEAELVEQVKNASPRVAEILIARRTGVEPDPDVVRDAAHAVLALQETVKKIKARIGPVIADLKRQADGELNPALREIRKSLGLREALLPAGKDS